MTLPGPGPGICNRLTLQMAVGSDPESVDLPIIVVAFPGSCVLVAVALEAIDGVSIYSNCDLRNAGLIALKG